MANRATLQMVGICWIGRLAWEVGQGRQPWFLAAMIPVFAAYRWAAYRRYRRRGGSVPG
jgi:hypothetical protein